MVSVGCGSGKLLLFGEHSAVYGHPAVGIGLPWGIKVSITETGLQEWELPSLLPEEGTNLRKLIDFAVNHFPALKKLGGMRVTIESDIPISMGFGSSAALCVALIKAFVTLLAGKVLPGSIARELGRSIDFLWRLANRAEQIFHGKPSGVDTGLSLMGNIQSFQFSGAGMPKNRTLRTDPFYLVIGGIPRSSNTNELVARVAAGMQAGDTAVCSRIASLGKLAEEAVCELKRSPKLVAAILGRLADRAHEQLKGLGLSSAELDAILDLGRECGAIGGKLSGAGGGGAFYLVAADLDSAQRIAAAVEAAFGGQAGEPFAVAVLVHNGRSTELI